MDHELPRRLDPRSPTITPIFNQAATRVPHLPPGGHGIASRQKIQAMRRELSRPTPTLEPSPRGSVVRGCNPEKDRRLAESIAAMTRVLEKKRNTAKRDFAKAAVAGTAKVAFNRAARPALRP